MGEEEEKKKNEIVWELGKLNQNLYALRTILEEVLENGICINPENKKRKLVWVKEANGIKGHFEISDLP